MTHLQEIELLEGIKQINATLKQLLEEQTKMRIQFSKYDDAYSELMISEEGHRPN